MIIMPYGWSWPIAAAQRPSRLLTPHRRLATATPQPFTMASPVGAPQAAAWKFPLLLHTSGHAAPGPYPPGSSRFML
jgi:hypothetical protein